MEVSGGTECSKTSRSNQNHGEESESEENDEESNNNKAKNNNGGSSSNSTIEENNEKKPTVRPYVRSKMPRLRWTPDLHLRFIHAVERLGGQDRATPKMVLQLMNIKGLSIAHVKSHLQMYRSKKIDDPSQVMADRNIYNLSQLPMLQGYNQSYVNSSFRYGDSSQSSREYFMHNPCISRSTMKETTQGLTDKIFGSNNRSWANFEFPISTSFLSSLSHDHQSDQKLLQSRLGTDKFIINPISQIHAKVEHLPTNTTSSAHLELNSSSTNVEKCKTTVKRKASDCNLDLDLSLRLTSKRSLEENSKEINSELSLSLFSPSSSSTSKLSRLKEGNKETSTRASTLDLTI